MLTFEINKTFASYEECEAWEEANLPNRTYQGHSILCVNHEEDMSSGSVKLTTIFAFQEEQQNGTINIRRTSQVLCPMVQ